MFHLRQVAKHTLAYTLIVLVMFFIIATAPTSVEALRVALAFGFGVTMALALQTGA